MRKRIYSIALSILATSFVACSGGGGGAGAASNGGSLGNTTPTVPPPAVSGRSQTARDEAPLVPSADGSGFVNLNVRDDNPNARGTVTMKGASD